MIVLTVRRMPLGLEKLCARAILTYLLIMGLNVGQLYQKHYWVFLAFVMAIETVARFFEDQPRQQSLPRACRGDAVEELEEDLVLQHRRV
jgi:hypothetical protein